VGLLKIVQSKTLWVEKIITQIERFEKANHSID